jgi:uncharacterized membrane protein YuzA (DUF378 family)
MKKIFLLGFVGLALSISGLAVPRLVLAQATCGDGTSLGDIKCGVDNADSNSPAVDSGVAAAVNILSTIVGFASVVMILYGGFRYVTSAGDANKAAAAKSTIMYALVGIVVVLLAQTIIKFTIAKTNKTQVDPVVGIPHG